MKDNSGQLLHGNAATFLTEFKRKPSKGSGICTIMTCIVTFIGQDLMNPTELSKTQYGQQRVKDQSMTNSITATRFNHNGYITYDMEFNTKMSGSWHTYYVNSSIIIGSYSLIPDPFHLQ